MDKLRFLKKNKSRQSLRLRVTLGIIIPLIMLLGVFTVFEYTRQRQNDLDTLATFSSHISRVIENDLRHQMLDSDFEGLQQLLRTIGELPEVEAVYLINPSAEVIFASHESLIGIQLNQQRPDCQICHQLSAAERSPGVVVVNQNGQQVFRNMQPIENEPECTQCHEKNTRLLGVLLTDISTAPFQETLNLNLRENLLWWIGSLIFTVILISLVINRLVLRRLTGLANAIMNFGLRKSQPALNENPPDEIGRIAREFNEMARQIDAYNAKNRALSKQIQRQNAQRGELLKRVITAQEDERKRVARELHDELGQMLSGLSIQAKALERFLDGSENPGAAHLTQVQTTVTEATEKMYNLILDLRPSSLDDFGLIYALQSHANRVLAQEDTTLEMDTEKFDRRLPPEIETAVFRVFQEALNNVVRHAHADHVKAVLACNGNMFWGQIIDDGIGFALQEIQMDGENPQGLGILGMQERITQLGGSLEIHTAPHKGTQILITIPMEDECG